MKLFNLYDLKYRGSKNEEQIEDQNEEKNDELNEDEAQNQEQELEYDQQDEEECSEEDDIGCDDSRDNIENNEEEGDKRRDEEEENGNDIIPGGNNMKYYILLICGINMVVNIFFEWFVMNYVNKLYAKKVIRDYKKEVEKEKLIDTQQKADNKEYEPNNKEVQIFKYQRIYFYDRRKDVKNSNKT